MKKSLLALASLVMLISCETKVADSSSGSDMASSDRNAADATSKVYRAIETGDVSALDTLFADDVIDHNGGANNTDVVGKDSVKAMLSQMHNYFDGLKMEMLHHGISADGQYHYSTVRMTGTSKANPWGMPEGMKVNHTGVDVVKIKDGKCTEHWNFMSMGDVNQMMMGMGGDHKPPPPTIVSVKKK
jgi:ketosteroid isomerase-like protein